jgi:ABC-type branched-subunit amino acid transport system ATPase component
MDTVFDKLVEINGLGIGIVMVEQNARRALALANRGYVLEAGRNAIEGSGATCFATRRCRALPRRLGYDRVELHFHEHVVRMNPDTK